MQDSIKIRLKEKAYKDNDYIYGEHDITSGGTVDTGMNFRAELKKTGSLCQSTSVLQRQRLSTNAMYPHFAN